MSGSLGKVQMLVKPVPVPKAVVKALLRGQAAGELVDCCGGGEVAVEIAQKAVVRGLLEKVLVYGVDRAGRARDKVELCFSGDASGEVMADLDGGKRSGIEALDAGFGRMVAHVAARMRQRGLRAEVRYGFIAEIDNDPTRRRALMEELGMVEAEIPKWREGYTPREVLRVRPGKDNGILSSFCTEFSRLASKIVGAGKGEAK